MNLQIPAVILAAALSLAAALPSLQLQTAAPGRAVERTVAMPG